MNLSRKRIPDSDDIRIVDTKTGEDIGRVAEDGAIVYPGKQGLRIVQSVNACDRMAKEMAELEKELASYKVSAKGIKPVNLDAISRRSDILFTHIRFEDFDLQEVLTDTTQKPHRLLNWLEFGECRILNESRFCRIESPIRDGITDFEHDTCKVVCIGLVGLQYKFTSNHVSHFDACLTPNPEDIQLHSPDFVPEEAGGESCEYDHCADTPHLILPEGLYVPPMYEFARVVAGKRVTITMGPRWSVLEPDDDEDKEES